MDDLAAEVNAANARIDELEKELAEAKDEIHNLNSVIRDMSSELRSHTHG